LQSDGGMAGVCLCRGGPYGTGGATLTALALSHCNNVCTAGRCRSTYRTTCP
jgi:hypothetical protein